MIDRQLFDGYSRALDANARLAAQSIDDFVTQLTGLVGNLSIEDLRGALLDYYPNVVRQFGDASATVALEFYEDIRAEAEAEGDYTPELADETSAQLLKDDVYVATKPKANGTTPENVSASMQGMAQRRVMQQADATIRRNVARDPAHPRWAFVPHIGACGFCIMLGSRGFAYWSEGTVLASRHHGCMCAPVADFDTANPHLDGYDPDAMYRAYDDARRTVTDQAWDDWRAMTDDQKRAYGAAYAHGAYGWNHFQQRAIVEEMNRRDREWLRTGNSPGVNREVISDAEWNDLKPYERAAWTALADRHGIAPFILPADSDLANIDAWMGGEFWELKSPGRGKHSTEDLISDARKKWRRLGLDSPIRVIVSNDRSGRDDREAFDEACRRCRWYGVSELLFVSADGESLKRVRFNTK